MEFEGELFRFVINYTDLTDYLEKIYILNMDSGDIKFKINNKEKILHFEKKEKEIKIDFDEAHFGIYNEPICFQNENKKNLFKIYNNSDLQLKKNLLEQINKDYDFYSLNGDKFLYEQIGKKNIKKIILKKINEYENIFKLLCKELPTNVNNIIINTNCFLPEGSQSLLINFNSELNLIVEQRSVLINKILEFLKKEEKFILKIYGRDGIGKSVTFLYFTTIKTNHRIIYFNLKDIYKYNSDKSQYFKNALMKYMQLIVFLI